MTEQGSQWLVRSVQISNGRPYIGMNKISLSPNMHARTKDISNLLASANAPPMALPTSTHNPPVQWVLAQ